MKLRPLLNFLFAVVLFSSVAPSAFGQEQASKQSKEATPAASTVDAPVVGSELKTTEKALSSGPTIHPLFIDIMKMRGLKPSGTTATLLSAKRVSPDGKAYGLEMTDEMLPLARENQKKSGVENVEFLKGEIENIPLPENSVDVVISNCVINLSADKDRSSGADLQDGTGESHVGRGAHCC